MQDDDYSVQEIQATIIDNLLNNEPSDCQQAIAVKPLFYKHINIINTDANYILFLWNISQ